MDTQQWVDLGIATFLGSILWFGVGTGTMPGNGIISPNRDEQPRVYWVSSATARAAK